MEDRLTQPCVRRARASRGDRLPPPTTLQEEQRRSTVATVVKGLRNWCRARSGRTLCLDDILGNSATQPGPPCMGYGVRLWGL